MTVFSIVHGDDVDGLTCGAFLKRVQGGEIYLANYDNLKKALQKVKPPVDRLYICDLNIREALLPEIERIREFAHIYIIDHHRMDPKVMKILKEMGVKITLETDDCAGVLVYDTYRTQLGNEGKRLAGYAAISDMFEDGPHGNKILAKMDNKFAQHEAQILTHALSADQSMRFKRRVLNELSRFSYPHRIPGAVEKSIQCLEKMTKIKELIPLNSVVTGRVAVMEAGRNQSTGGISNLLIDTLGVDVGISYKENGEYYNMSLRGEQMLEAHLGDISKEVGAKYGGFGGGHQKASGMKVPKIHFQDVLNEIREKIN